MYGPVLVEVFEEALLPTWARRLPRVLEMTGTTKDTQNHDDQNKKNKNRNKDTYSQGSSSGRFLYLSCVRGSASE